MANESTLVAHLIPHLTDQVENAATEALGYVLNKSEPSREALADMLREGGFAMPPIVRVATEVELDDEYGSRPDMSGYVENGDKRRLLVESKFGAALQPKQAVRYLRWIIGKTGDDPAALLFIAPGVRVATLWAEILRQIGKSEDITLHPSESAANSWRSAMVSGAPNKRLALVGWDRLLSAMSERAGDDADDDAVANIRQIQGLARRYDSEEFLPVHAEHLSPDFARRAVGYANLVDDAVGIGVARGWASTENLKVAPKKYGYGRYLWLGEVDDCFWLGVNHVMWARHGDTPLWLRHSHDKDEWELDEWDPENWRPIHLKQGVEYHEVLDDAASELEALAKEITRKWG